MHLYNRSADFSTPTDSKSHIQLILSLIVKFHEDGVSFDCKEVLILLLGHLGSAGNSLDLILVKFPRHLRALLNGSV